MANFYGKIRLCELRFFIFLILWLLIVPRNTKLSHGSLVGFWLIFLKDYGSLTMTSSLVSNSEHFLEAGSHPVLNSWFQGNILQTGAQSSEKGGVQWTLQCPESSSLWTVQGEETKPTHTGGLGGRMDGSFHSEQLTVWWRFTVSSKIFTSQSLTIFWEHLAALNL